MEARLLCVGDMHLGRLPSGLPADEGGEDAAHFGPAAAWRAAVDRALALEVDALLLAGDVIESLEDRFAAFGALEAGVRRLIEARVPVIAVAGNHDVVALPRLAERIPGFRLLGRGGRWESVVVESRAGIPIHVHGWSFPAPRVRESPLAGQRFAQRGSREGVHLGLLHCDLDRRGGYHAPVTRRELEASGLDAWILGHVHRPDDLAAMAEPIGYLGSLAPLDPGEPGPHGPWLVRIARAGAAPRFEHLAQAALRFERIETELGGLDGAGTGADSGQDTLEDRLFELLRETARARARELGARLDATRSVGCRFVLRGRTRAHRAVARVVQSGTLLGHDLGIGEKRFYVEKLVDEGRLAVDLASRARGTDPPAILARKLLALDRDDDEGRRMVAEARRQLTAEARRGTWARLALGTGGSADDEAVLGDEAVRARLIAAGTRALEELLAQVEGQA